MQEFYNQEAEYAAFLAGGEAFVVNDYGPTWRRLHRGDCAVLNRAGPATGGRHTSVRKICSYDLAGLTDYLRSKVGGEGDAYQKCEFCFKD
jgi:hypothetical protein